MVELVPHWEVGEVLYPACMVVVRRQTLGDLVAVVQGPEVFLWSPRLPGLRQMLVIGEL